MQTSTCDKEKKVEPSAAVSLKDSLARLQEASSEVKHAAKTSPLKRPAAVLSAGDVTKKKSNKSPMQRPAAKQCSMMKKPAAAMMKKPAAALHALASAGPGPVPNGNGKKMPSKARRVELCPHGCCTCRFVAGHAPSCWIKKGWTV